MSRALRIETPRLYLRSPKRRDYKVWRDLRIANRDHLQPFEPLWSKATNTRGEWGLRVRAWREGLRDGRLYAFLIFNRETDALLGGLALSNVYRGASQTATLGYWLDAGATGNGYMSEAVKHTCQWAGRTLGLARIEASTLPENVKSRKVLEGCGFREEGLAQSYLQIAGERRDHMLYGLVLTP